LIKKINDLTYAHQNVLCSKYLLAKIPFCFLSQGQKSERPISIQYGDGEEGTKKLNPIDNFVIQRHKHLRKGLRQLGLNEHIETLEFVAKSITGYVCPSNLFFRQSF